MVLDATFDGILARAFWVDGLYDEFAAETGRRTDISLLLSVFDGVLVSGVAIAGNKVCGTLARHWEEGHRPASGD